MPLIEIARQSEEEGGYLTANPSEGFDSKVYLKERMKQAQNMQQPMIFVIRAISLLVRSCQFLGGSEQPRIGPEGVKAAKNLFNGRIDPQTGELLGHFLEKDELDLLINYIANRVWWRSPAQEFPMVLNSISDMFAYVASNNKEFSHVYIQEIFKALSVSNFMTVKKYERPLLLLVKIQDTY